MGQFFILRSRVQQEYNSLLVNALNRIFKSNLSLNNFKWLLTKVELSCVRNIIPRSRKCLWNGYPFLNQELQNHDPVGRHIPVWVMYGSTPPPRAACSRRAGKVFPVFQYLTNFFWGCERYADFMRDILKRSFSRVHKPSEVWEF